MSVYPIREIQGLQFFHEPTACIAHFDNMHWTKKALSLIQSFGTLLAYAWHKMSLMWHRVEVQMRPFGEINPLDNCKTRLVVCLHGLNNNPSQFKILVDEMQKQDLSETAIFIPPILQKGNARLDEMVQPIFKAITDWSRASDAQSGEKEVVLVGVSNGGRIARAIETALSLQGEEDANIANLRLISIVGACKGSSLVNLVNRCGLSSLISQNIAEEMATDSQRTQRLDQEWEQGVSSRPARDYTFIASPHDWQVTNYSSSLMEVGDQNGRYAIVPGHGHNSIVNRVAQTVSEIIFA